MKEGTHQASASKAASAFLSAGTSRVAASSKSRCSASRASFRTSQSLSFPLWPKSPRSTSATTTCEQLIAGKLSLT